MRDDSTNQHMPLNEAPIFDEIARAYDDAIEQKLLAEPDDIDEVERYANEARETPVFYDLADEYRERERRANEAVRWYHDESTSTSETMEGQLQSGIEQMDRAAAVLRYVREEELRLDAMKAQRRFFSTRKPLTKESLINQEAVLGSKIVSTKVGHEYFFLYDDHDNWMFYEQPSKDGLVRHPSILHYEIVDGTVVRHELGKPSAEVKGEEFLRLWYTIAFYHDAVLREVYNRNPETGEKFQ